MTEETILKSLNSSRSISSNVDVLIIETGGGFFNSVFKNEFAFSLEVFILIITPCASLETVPLIFSSCARLKTKGRNPTP